MLNIQLKQFIDLDILLFLLCTIIVINKKKLYHAIYEIHLISVITLIHEPNGCKWH